MFYYFRQEKGRPEDSELNGSKRIPNLIRSSLCEFNFGLLLSFPNILTLPQVTILYHILVTRHEHTLSSTCFHF
jgi:hypothetical protein